MKDIGSFLVDNVFQITSDEQFLSLALDTFRFQYKNNPIYKDFVNKLNVDYTKIDRLEKIPFLPISFFKTHQVLVESKSVEKTFLSSGTTQMSRSKHQVHDLAIYQKSFIKCFEKFFGKTEELAILCLLPSYQEQGDSSLIYMTDHLISLSKDKRSGYYLENGKKLNQTILELEKDEKPFVLFGVAYSLLDYVEQFSHQLSFGKVIETGGMKGRRKELTKVQLHNELEKGFGKGTICSEYGMTELLSQAYSLLGNSFQTPPWMKVLLRATSDPFDLSKTSGLINVIDLANIYSCSFIATDDVGRYNNDQSFQVLGRYDYADTRGCNLLVQ